MTNEGIEASADGFAVDGGRTELGFLTLALAQLVSFFGIWFGAWPNSFGMTGSVGYGLSAFFFACGVAGFYLSFQSLSAT